MKSIPPLLAILFVLTACSDDSESCDGPFLDKIDSKKVYYYINGLVAQLTWGRVTKFYYSETGQVIEITTPPEEHSLVDQARFFYNEDGTINYILRYQDGVQVDSIAITSDTQQRIIKLMDFKPHFEDPELRLYETVEYEYEGMNSTKSMIYRYNGYEQTTLTDYDNNPRPIPAEARFMDFLYSPFYFSENNVIRFTYQTSAGGNSFSTQEFKYNAEGYPVKATLLGTTVRFSYTCNPRPAKGQ